MTTIAETLHYAADECLWDGRWDGRSRGHISKYSCDAVHLAAFDLGLSECKRKAMFTGLRRMGVDTRGLLQFSDFVNDSRRAQGARYAWLKFAAMIAEEQGV